MLATMVIPPSFHISSALPKVGIKFQNSYITFNNQNFPFKFKVGSWDHRPTWL